MPGGHVPSPERETKYRDFRHFHFDQVRAFKRRLTDGESQATGERLSKATICATLGNLTRFPVTFQSPGYKSRISYADAEYFNPSDKKTAGSLLRGANDRCPRLTISNGSSPGLSSAYCGGHLTVP
jgi:hypothetical protein